MAKEPVRPARQALHSEQALAVVGGAPPAPPPGSVALLTEVPPPPGTIPPPPGTIPPPPPAPPAAGGNKLRVGKQPWPCVRCETSNPFETSTCSACGMSFLDGLSEPLPQVPLIGKIDGSTFVGKLKIGFIGFVPLVLILVVLLTVAGFIAK